MRSIDALTFSIPFPFLQLTSRISTLSGLFSPSWAITCSAFMVEFSWSILVISKISGKLKPENSLEAALI